MAIQSKDAPSVRIGCKSGSAGVIISAGRKSPFAMSKVFAAVEMLEHKADSQITDWAL